MLYGSITNTLLAAGLETNSNITEATVMNKLQYAQSIIDGMISDVYQIPLPVFYENVITFSGTGDSTGTMTISIDGHDYAISITDGLTASQAADLFRNAVIDDGTATFQVDEIEDDEAVRIISNGTGDKTQVQITSTDPQTVAGITATGATVSPTSHAFIRGLAEEIAAARLLQIAYGKEAENTDKDGYNRMVLALAELNRVVIKKVKLFDFNGNEFTTSDRTSMDFAPNNITSSGNGTKDDTSARFSVNQDF